MISRETIDEIKNRIDIIDVIDIIQHVCMGTATLLTADIVSVMADTVTGKMTLNALYAALPEHRPETIRCHLQRHCKYRKQSWVESKGWADVFRLDNGGIWALRPELFKRLQFDASP